MSAKKPEEIEEDFLEVDTPIPGQNFACLSFVSPEKELANKEVFLLHQFLKSKSKDYDTTEEQLVEEYGDYLYNNRTKLEKEFYERNDFQTTVRGVKVRGVYDTYREAQVRAKLLQRKDKNFHVFVGQVGYWLPWDPNADEVENQEYSESQLNKLVKKYQENTKKRDTFFEQQKEDSLKKIKEEQVEASEDNDVPNPVRDAQPPVPSNSDPLQDEDPWLKRKKEQLNEDNNTTEGNPSENATVKSDDNILDLDA